jgi:signal transduction histidine kinase
VNGPSPELDAAPPAGGTTQAASDERWRLRVELRILGVLGAGWCSTILLALPWPWATLGVGGDFADLPWLVLLAPQLVALTVIGTLLLVELPLARWPNGRKVRSPHPWPLLLAGFPLLPFVPLLLWRDRKARLAPPPSLDDAELAFHRLLALPTVMGLRFLVWVSMAFVVDAIVLGARADWSRDHMVAMALLWIGLMGPTTAIMTGWMRAIVRPETLTAPRSTRTVQGETDLRLRLTVGASIASFGVVLAPLCAGYLWISARMPDERAAEAHALAAELTLLARNGPEVEFGRALGENPTATVTRRGRVFGARRTVPTEQGPIDSNGDGVADLYVLRTRDATAVVTLPPLRPPPLGLLLVAGILALIAVITTIVIIARDIYRDVTRATAQVDAVSRGRAPPPLGDLAFSTFEIQLLLQSVDRMMSRISDANVAKYVAIERAKEADRLKSQFLANMSHDLRSPLNSILGFSELLLTGIDGELSAQQRSMVEPIYQSGRDLLQQIDDILDTAKIEASRLDLHPEPTPVTTLVNRAIHGAKKRRAEDIEYLVQVSPGLPPAFCDPHRTVQAIENVLLFATERIGTRDERSDDERKIVVQLRQGKTDRGRMIFVEVRTPVRPATAEQLARARRGFYRIPGHRGLGLGLPIAGSILELEGGGLGIEDLGHAMIFTIELCAPESRRVAVREVRGVG